MGENLANHVHRKILHIYPLSAPFDVMFLDFLNPGDAIFYSSSHNKDSLLIGKVFTGPDGVTGLATGIGIEHVASLIIAAKYFEFIIQPYGLQFLVVFDQDGEF